MLSPRYLDGVSDEIADIYAQLETDILSDMARRIARLGRITESTKWQAALLKEQGALHKDINRIIKGYAKPIRDEITAAYNDAVVKSIRADNMIFKQALGHGVSDRSAQLMLANIKKTYSDLSRLTLTTAATSEAKFVNQANAAYMQVATGAFDYDTAMENACRNLAKDGVTAIQYRNGTPVQYTIEAAVRMNILTGINQTAATITMSNCEELDCDLVETSAHIGARPEHEEWQGEVFSLSGKNPKYRPFSVCGLGEVTGICGINCRHSFYPYFEGEESHYTEKELDEMASQEVSFNGQTMTRYEGEQKLRGIERNIRHYKREAMTLEAGGVDNTAARQKLGKWQAVARDFTEQTGIKRDTAREFIGTENGKQPTGLKPKTAAAVQPVVTPSATIDEKTAKAMAELTDNPKSNIRTQLEAIGVKELPVKAFETQPTEEEIINRLAGGDKTKGSCSSVAFAYTANKSGFDVLDFRGGKSLDVFSTRSVIEQIANLNGVKSETILEKNDFTAAHKLFKKVEEGKQYYLSVGSHASIIMKYKGRMGYLELQSADTNRMKVWKLLDDYWLKERFGCQKSHTVHGVKLTLSSTLIDIESLGKNKEFIELMKYINTSAGEQKKGIGGYAK